MDATFQNLRLSTVTGEQNYIKANPLYFAVGTSVNQIALSFPLSGRIICRLCCFSDPLFFYTPHHNSLMQCNRAAGGPLRSATWTSPGASIPRLRASMATLVQC